MTTTISSSFDYGPTKDFWTGQTYTRTTTASPFVYTSTATTVGDGASIGATAAILDFSIGNTVTTIAQDAFLNCFNAGSGLVLTIPNSVTSIAQGVFSGTLFDGFIIGTGLATIGSGALASTNYATIAIGTTNANFEVVDNVLYTTGQLILNSYPLLKAGTSYTIPNATTTIGPGAFGGNTNLTTIITGTGLTTVGVGAFSSCTALATFTNNSTAGINTLGESCFQFTAFSSFVIPNTVTVMGTHVFGNCPNLLNLTIGSSVPSGIIDFAYYGSPALQNYFVAGGSTNYSSIDGILYNIAAGAYELILVPPATTTTNLIVLSGVLTITGCNSPNLISVSFPASVTLINPYACAYNSALTSITFADGSNPVSTGYSFLGNGVLSNITIPNSFTNLSPNDFGGCTKLKTDTGAPYQGTLHTNALPGDYVYDLFLPAGTNAFYVNYDYIPPPPVCFKEGSKILRVNSETGKEEYIVIQDLRKGDLIKTVSSGLKKIEHIGYSKMYNNVNAIRSNNKLYRCSTSEYKELTEDLIITGCHSILIKNFKDQEQIEKTQEVLGKIFITEKHYRLPACVDERTKIFEEDGVHTIWHFSLEHSDYYMNYGVYANGLLVETTSHRMMLELSGMTLV